MIVLGIDPGTALVGWGFVDTGPGNDLSKAKCLGYGCISTDKSMTASQRLLAVSNGMEQLLKEQRPDLVSIEKLFFAKNQTTAMAVSQARGVILLAIEKAGLPIVEFSPPQIKQALTGYGKAEKAQIQHMVAMLLRLPGIPKPDDAADALAIAITGAQTRQF